MEVIELLCVCSNEVSIEVNNPERLRRRGECGEFSPVTARRKAKTVREKPEARTLHLQCIVIESYELF